MRKNKLFLLLALLLTAATGAWAANTVTWTAQNQLPTLEGKTTATIDGVTITTPSAITVSSGRATFNVATFSVTEGNITKIVLKSISGVTDYPTGWTISDNTEATWTGSAKSVSCGYSGGVYSIEFTIETVYTVTMAKGTVDATNWTINPAEAAEGTEVTLQYNGRMKVKGVTATSDEKPAAPSVTEVTTFSELQTALSAGKDVKLKNDIVCTEEISITSGALTIDGNGKKLSTTSEIRAFKVGSSATVAFKNLTLTGFVSGGGPAINNSGTIVLDGCTISNCHVSNSDGGGAIENKGSSSKLYAINTTFSGNYSGEIGGAINNYRGSLYMSGCTFINNYTTKSDAYYGGAIGINGGNEVRLINCAFSGNKYGTATGTSDIGVFNKPENYTIAGCTGVTIASDDGDITTIASGTATLDYSDLSNISFTYNAE